MNVASLQNICHSFGELEILKTIDIEIKEGSTNGLIGPSGSGKSTLLYILSGILTPSKGRVIIMEKELQNENDIMEARRKYFGFIYQFHNLIPELTAFENILIAQKICNKVDINFINFLLKELEVFQKKDYKIANLSGGEAQRFAIARAFATKPKIVFADEPTGNLDPKTAQTTIDLIFKLSKNNNSSLFLVTHNHTFLKKFDRCFAIEERGLKIIQQ